MVITALTDNVNRAIADVKTVWKKHDVKQAAQGSVLFQFEKRGRIEVAGEADEEKVRTYCSCTSRCPPILIVSTVEVLKSPDFPIRVHLKGFPAWTNSISLAMLASGLA